MAKLITIPEWCKNQKKSGIVKNMKVLEWLKKKFWNSPECRTLEMFQKVKILEVVKYIFSGTVNNLNIFEWSRMQKFFNCPEYKKKFLNGPEIIFFGMVKNDKVLEV